MNLRDQQFALLCGAWVFALLGGVGAVGYIEAGGSVAPLSIIVVISGVVGAISLGVLAVALVTTKRSHTIQQIPGAIAVVTGGLISIGGLAALQPWAYTGIAQGVASAFGAFVVGFGGLLVITGAISIRTSKIKLPLYACAVVWCGGWIYTAQLSPLIMTRYSLPIVAIILVVTVGPLIGIKAWSPSDGTRHSLDNKHQARTE